MHEMSIEVPRMTRGEVGVTLHVMVKNGESVVGRLLDCVGPYVRSVVAVLNDCSDRTEGVLEEGCARHGLILTCRHVTRESHPHFYLLDVPETYQVGSPLAGEVFPDAYTGDLLLADWSAARNVGWMMPTWEWKLFLDADDVVDDPEVIPGLCWSLQERGVEAAASRYHYYASSGGGDWRADAFRERLARSFPWIRWRDRVHEVLTGYAKDRVARIEGNLVVRDLRDSLGAGTRPPWRNLKILYHRARSAGWESLTPRETAYLAVESRECMPDLCLALARRYLSFPHEHREESAWLCSVAGEVEEVRHRYLEAARWYELSLAHHPGTLSAYRLSRVRFLLRDWEGSLAAYDVGAKNAATTQLLDGGDAQGRAARVIAASCLASLGRLPEALAMVRKARAEFPDNQKLRELEEAISSRLGETS